MEPLSWHLPALVPPGPVQALPLLEAPVQLQYSQVLRSQAPPVAVPSGTLPPAWRRKVLQSKFRSAS
jgi:hypothetical protein